MTRLAQNKQKSHCDPQEEKVTKNTYYYLWKEVVDIKRVILS